MDTRDSATVYQRRDAGNAQNYGVDFDAHKLAKRLGWFSIGLGAAKLLFPRTVVKLIGAPASAPAVLVRLFGLCEIASGAMLFMPGRTRAAGLWSRVAGDAADAAMLATAYTRPTADRQALRIAAAGVLGVTALDVLSAKQISRQTGLMSDSGALRATKSITINRAPGEVYAYWRDVTNLPRFMYHVESVAILSDIRSRWTVKAPAGKTVEWDAEITEDRPGEFLSWKTVQEDVPNAGSVRFEPRPGGRGAIVRVDLEYTPPGIIAGAVVATLFNRSPAQQMDDDLRRLKQILETGEVMRSDGSPQGTGRILQRPARPGASE